MGKTTSLFRPVGYRDGLLLLKPEDGSSSGSWCEGWARLGPSPLPPAPLPVPPHQTLQPRGSPSVHWWVLGLVRRAAQPLMLLSFTHNLFLWVFSLGFACQINSPEESFLLRPPVTIPREPKLANPQRA